MRQTELKLTEQNRSDVESIRGKGLHHSREVNRAQVLSCLDRGIPEIQIMAVLAIGPTTVWRTRLAYLHGRLEVAAFDVARLGRPTQYDMDARARMTSLVCSSPPHGRQRWTIVELEPGLVKLCRETVPRLLKNAISNFGANWCGALAHLRMSTGSAHITC